MSEQAKAGGPLCRLEPPVGPCAAEVTAAGYINIAAHPHDRAAVEDAASRGGVNAAIAVTKHGVLSKAQCRFMVPIFAHDDEVDALIRWERDVLPPKAPCEVGGNASKCWRQSCDEAGHCVSPNA